MNPQKVFIYLLARILMYFIKVGLRGSFFPLPPKLKPKYVMKRGTLQRIDLNDNTWKTYIIEKLKEIKEIIKEMCRDKP